MASRALATPTPDFTRDIVPILDRRCVSCHGDEKQDGKLNLRDREGIEQGGESGLRLVNVAFEANELWRRVAGDDAEVRMPPEGPPLDPSDLKIIEQWARAGAPISSEKLPAPVPEAESPWILWLANLVPERLDPVFNFLERGQADYGSALYLAIAFIAAIIVAEQVKRRGKGASRIASLLRQRATPARYLGVALGILAWGVWLHIVALHARESALEARIAMLENATQKFTSPPKGFLEDFQPTRPKHPPRLGGTYYRGNDERSARLFNGGFYRTATMRLDLCDSDGRRLAWGDPFPSDGTFIRLEIERAPMATPTLYRPAIMAKAFVSPCRPSVEVEDLAAKIYPLETIQEGERWKVRFPIQLPAPGADETVVSAGDFYLYNATPKKTHITERPHFGIRYRIVVKEGTIQPESELWMGSLYKLSKLFYPPPDKILPDEWFDFREIPVIEGNNTTDPELLGVEEHKEKLKE